LNSQRFLESDRRYKILFSDIWEERLRLSVVQLNWRKLNRKRYRNACHEWSPSRSTNRRNLALLRREKNWSSRVTERKVKSIKMINIGLRGRLVLRASRRVTRQLLELISSKLENTLLDLLREGGTTIGILACFGIPITLRATSDNVPAASKGCTLLWDCFRGWWQPAGQCRLCRSRESASLLANYKILDNRVCHSFGMRDPLITHRSRISHADRDIRIFAEPSFFQPSQLGRWITAVTTAALGFAPIIAPE